MFMIAESVNMVIQGRRIHFRLSTTRPNKHGSVFLVPWRLVEFITIQRILFKSLFIRYLKHTAMYIV